MNNLPPLNVLLSERQNPFTGGVGVDEFEDLFSSIDNSGIVAVTRRRVLQGLAGEVRNRLIGPYRTVTDLENGNLLLVIARAPNDLKMLLSIQNVRKKFRYIAGYVIDSYFTENFPSVTTHYDHIFSTTQEGAEVVKSRFGTSSSVLPQGFDCLSWACMNVSRIIVLIVFGRQTQSYHREFHRAFHNNSSPLLSLH